MYSGCLTQFAQYPTSFQEKHGHLEGCKKREANKSMINIYPNIAKHRPRTIDIRHAKPGRGCVVGSWWKGGTWNEGPNSRGFYTHYHGNPQPSFLAVMTHILRPKPFIFHGFGVQRYKDCFLTGGMSLSPICPQYFGSWSTLAHIVKNFC